MLPQTGNGFSVAKKSNYFAQTRGPWRGELGSVATWMWAEEAAVARCRNAAEQLQPQLGGFGGSPALKG